jgi:methylated-DNA-[protein]-cysteine S-methyltransferase
MRAYLAGELNALDRLPADAGGTPFQQEVWAALRTIPPGVTWSYKQLALRIGRPAAVRAVGLANGSNPIGIVVPCHRVIGANGTLTGYGGGLPRKRWLLEHEGVLLRIGA